jgi:hypothetical protein
MDLTERKANFPYIGNILRRNIRGLRIGHGKQALSRAVA